MAKRGRLSASQVDLYLGCARKYWFQYGPKKIRPPQAKSAALGEAAHKLIEDTLTAPNVDLAVRLLTARQDPPALIARKWLMMLPRDVIEHGAEYEHEFSFRLWSNRQWYMVGKIDVYRPDDRLTLIADYKSTSDLRYAKEEHEAERNIQLLTYGMFAVLESGARKVRLSFLYATSRAKTWRGVRSKETTVTLSRGQIEDRFSRFEPRLEEMIETRKHDRARDVQPNYDHCDAYGGCPFRERCVSLMFRRKGIGR